MRAVAFMEFGGADVLRTVELEEPVAGPGEVLVKVMAAPVNPTDLMMRSGQQAALMTSLTPPYIAGMEFAGYVHRLGGDSAGLAIGQAVMGVVNPRLPAGGAHAEYIRVPTASLVPLDPGVDLAEAATVPMNGLSAKMVIDALEPRPGSTLLVTGAAGAVGGYVIQLAKHAGLTVIADAKDADVELVRRLGADTIVPRGDAMEAAVRRVCPHGVDGLVDGALIGDRATALVRDGGTAVSLRRSNPINDARLRARYVSVIDQIGNTAALAWLAELVRDGILTPRVGMRLPMTEAAQAFRLVEQGGLRGRVVLMFNHPHQAGD